MRHNIGIVVLLAMASVCLCAVPAGAALIAYEGFDYATGALDSGNGGSGWGTSWYATPGNPASGGSTATVSSGSLTSSASRFDSVGNKLTAQGSWLTNCRQLAEDSVDLDVTGEIVYMSFLLQIGNDADGALVAYNQIDGTQIGWAGCPHSLRGMVALTSDTGLVTLTANTTYFVVTKLTTTAGETAYDHYSVLYYAPDATVPIEDPGVYDATRHRAQVGIVRELNLYFNAVASGTSFIDEVRIGETWADVAVGELRPGDASGNGVVDEEDAAILATNWLTSEGATWSMGDFNDDGKVDDQDATIMATNWSGSEAASAPEPSTTLMLLVLAATWAVAALRRR